MILRWHDKGLTWDPNSWAGIDMVYLKSTDIWKPDLLITNQTNWENQNFGNVDNNLVRVWAERSSESDLGLFNVEWSPNLSFEVYH